MGGGGGGGVGGILLEVPNIIMKPVMNFEQEFILDLELGRGTFKQRVDVGETLQLPNRSGGIFFIDALR